MVEYERKNDYDHGKAVCLIIVKYQHNLSNISTKCKMLALIVKYQHRSVLLQFVDTKTSQLISPAHSNHSLGQ